MCRELRLRYHFQDLPTNPKVTGLGVLKRLGIWLGGSPGRSQVGNLALAQVWSGLRDGCGRAQSY
jgi:hypothetical protein